MSNLKHWQERIKEKNNNIEFREFIKNMGSWFPLNFYKNNGLISRYPETKRMKNILAVKEFEKVRNNLSKENYNIDNSFMSNFKNLFGNITFGSLVDYGGNENSDYSDMTFSSNNIYISIGIITNCENVLYGISVKDNSKDIINGLSVWRSSNIVYQSAGITESYKIFYSRNIRISSNIWFSSNLTGCMECIFCDNLQNQKYFIKNKSYTKEEYFKQKELILKDKDNFYRYYNELNKIGENIASDNVTGNYIVDSSDIEDGYYCSNVKGGKNLLMVGGVDGDEDMYNVFAGGTPTANDFYSVMGANGDNLYSCVNIITSSNIYYSLFLESCSYCVGCIGLKNKSYCILNKQYTKKEWEILADKIFSQMEREGILGDFFPGELNPFYFNDTMGSLLGNFTKEEVEKQGYMWRDEKIKVDIPEGSEVIESKDLKKIQGYNSSGKWEIDPEILNKVIKDSNGNYYKIVKPEYDFLLKYGLPLPETHWLDRMKINLGV